MSHPAAATAGVMNLVQMSRSLRFFLSTFDRFPEVKMTGAC
jgi:hypothetical protein